jgi:hypothetical protein
MLAAMATITSTTIKNTTMITGSTPQTSARRKPARQCNCDGKL